MIGDLISLKTADRNKNFLEMIKAILKILQTKLPILSIVLNGTADVFNGITIAGPSIIFNPNNELNCSIWLNTE